MSTRADIEFVGGPLDGYRQTMTLPAEVFVCIAVLSPARRRTALRRMLDWICGRHAKPIGLAVYELEESLGGCRYRHVGTQSLVQDRSGQLKRFGPRYQISCYSQK
jgi:hypothetical protein